MIVIAAARVTSLPPSAYVAMFYRVGISLYYVSVFQGRQQTTLYLPKIGDVVRKSRYCCGSKSNHGATTYMYSGARP